MPGSDFLAFSRRQPVGARLEESDQGPGGPVQAIRGALVTYRRITQRGNLGPYRPTSTQQGGDFDGFEIRMRENGATAEVLGFETAWQQRLNFLPGVWSGLGIMAN